MIMTLMAKQKGLSYEQKLINALNKLPNPLEDKRHNISIFFDDNRARSNQSRFEHIVSIRHGLTPRDILRIPRHIKTCIFKKENGRNNTFNIYIKRNSYSEEYIKISIEVKPEEPNKATVKTIFITENIK